jgi:hypothetical protein
MWSLVDTPKTELVMLVIDRCNFPVVAGLRCMAIVDLGVGTGVVQRAGEDSHRDGAGMSAGRGGVSPATEFTAGRANECENEPDGEQDDPQRPQDGTPRTKPRTRQIRPTTITTRPPEVTGESRLLAE